MIGPDEDEKASIVDSLVGGPSDGRGRRVSGAKGGKGGKRDASQNRGRSKKGGSLKPGERAMSPSTPRTNAEMRDEARKVKLEWKKIKEEQMALERMRKKMHKEQEKLKRDKNQLQIDIRTFNYNKDRKKGGKSYSDKYAESEEEKLRKQLFNEQQGWQEERMLFREQITQLENQNAILKFCLFFLLFVWCRFISRFVLFVCWKIWLVFVLFYFVCLFVCKWFFFFFD